MCSAELSVCMWFLTPDARYAMRSEVTISVLHAAAPLLLLACHVGAVPTAHLCIYYLVIVVWPLQESG